MSEIREQFLGDKVKAKDSYDNILAVVQSKIKSNYSELIASNNINDIKDNLLTAIQKILTDEKIAVNGMSSIELSN